MSAAANESVRGNNMAEAPGSARTAATEMAQNAHPAIQRYLREMAVGLKGLVAPRSAQLLLEETAYWLQRNTRKLEASGLPYEEAAEQAVKEHQPPRDLALDLIEDYFESEADTPLIKRLGRANAIALGLFGLGNAICLLLWQLAIQFPVETSIDKGWAPAAFFRFYPSQLPFPALNWQFLVTACCPLAAPIVIGWMVGRLVPVRAATVVFYALLPIIVFSFLVAVALLPNKTGLYYGIVQALYGLPVGSASASISSSLRRRQRQRTRLK